MLALLTWIVALAIPTMAIDKFYSTDANEFIIEFDAKFHSKLTAERIRGFSEYEKTFYQRYEITPTFRYLFGPGNYRKIGNPLGDQKLTVHWDQLTEENGKVVLPYSYRGHWFVNANSVAGQFELPLPFHPDGLQVQDWEKCTDSNPDHWSLDSLWYYWDPNRYNCPYKLDEHYQMIKARLSAQTPATQTSYPEYERMLEDGKLTMTFAFGYAVENDSPNPETDSDIGVEQYRRFRQHVRQNFQLQEAPILATEYGLSSDHRVGSLFTGSRDGHLVEIRVVINAGVDQMALFAKSYANLHDDFFGWLGHSRLGSGFDANLFQQFLWSNPGTYSISPKYQMVYWGGCNSYAYYTTPFFRLKHELSPMSDPLGIRNLDIIANGFSSFFYMNSKNSMVILNALMNTPAKTSYQTIIDNLTRAGWATILPMVLGDEDNPTN